MGVYCNFGEIVLLLSQTKESERKALLGFYAVAYRIERDGIPPHWNRVKELHESIKSFEKSPPSLSFLSNVLGSVLSSIVIPYNRCLNLVKLDPDRDLFAFYHIKEPRNLVFRKHDDVIISSYLIM